MSKTTEPKPPSVLAAEAASDNANARLGRLFKRRGELFTGVGRADYGDDEWPLCIHCSESDIRCLEAQHLAGQYDDIPKVIVCANDYRVLTDRCTCDFLPWHRAGTVRTPPREKELLRLVADLEKDRSLSKPLILPAPRVTADDAPPVFRRHHKRRAKLFARIGRTDYAENEWPQCIVCGSCDIRCLEAHHIAGQYADFAQVVVCLNHHRILSDLQIDHPAWEGDAAFSEGFCGLADLLKLMADFYEGQNA